MIHHLPDVSIQLLLVQFYMITARLLISKRSRAIICLFPQLIELTPQKGQSVSNGGITSL